MQKISPFLWFDDRAEEAINFYVSIFKNSKMVNANSSAGWQTCLRRHSSLKARNLWRSMAGQSSNSRRPFPSS